MVTSAALFFFFRWAHFLAGITWIGILYYFNLVHVPFMAEADAAAKPSVVGKLLPRALWWFRWGAVFTLLAGLLLLGLDLMNFKAAPNAVEAFYDSWLGWGISYGGLMGIIMFVNVWAVIWPKQQIVMASAAQVASGGAALPEAAASARRAFLASRTNFILSIPMLMFMGAGRWFPLRAPDTGAKIAALVFMLVVLGAVEAVALTGDKGPLTKPLDTVKSAITEGFVLAFLSLGFFVVAFGLP